LENNQHVTASVAVFMIMGNWQKQQSVLWTLLTEKHFSVTSGSIQAMLTSPLSMGHGDWSVGSSAGFLVAPGPGADRSPAAGFMSGQSPGREAELPNARTIANDAVLKPQLVRTITAMKTLSPGKHDKSCQFCQYARAAKALSIA
jgi:hypothetical protein